MLAPSVSHLQPARESPSPLIVAGLLKNHGAATRIPPRPHTMITDIIWKIGPV